MLSAAPARRYPRCEDVALALDELVRPRPQTPDDLKALIERLGPVPAETELATPGDFVLGLSKKPALRLVAVRVAYASAGQQPYSESDLEGSPARRRRGGGLFDLDADGDGRSFASGLVDVMIKARGWSLSSGLHVGSRQAGPRWSDRRLDAFGHYTQLGRVIARRFEPVVRYSALLPDPSHDVTGGLNVFFRGHPFKWQTFATVRFQPRDAASGHDMRVQTHLSLWF